MWGRWCYRSSIIDNSPCLAFIGRFTAAVTDMQLRSLLADLDNDGCALEVKWRGSFGLFPM